MKTAIKTNRYEAAHGKAPRGLGFWVFETKDGQEALTIRATWSEAKKAAQQTNHAVLYAAS